MTLETLLRLLGESRDIAQEGANLGGMPEETVDLYVSTSGNDTNRGTSQAKPLATINEALKRVNPGGVFAIHLMGAGPYSMQGYYGVMPVAGPCEKALQIIGDPAMSVVLGSLVAAAGTTNVIVKGAYGADYRGKYIRFTTGAAAGTVKQIGKSTADTLFMTGVSFGEAAIGPGDHYEIIQPLTQVDWSGSPEFQMQGSRLIFQNIKFFQDGAISIFSGPGLLNTPGCEIDLGGGAIAFLNMSVIGVDDEFGTTNGLYIHDGNVLNYFESFFGTFAVFKACKVLTAYTSQCRLGDVFGGVASGFAADTYFFVGSGCSLEDSANPVINGFGPPPTHAQIDGSHSEVGRPVFDLQPGAYLGLYDTALNGFLADGILAKGARMELDKCTGTGAGGSGHGVTIKTATTGSVTANTTVAGAGGDLAFNGVTKAYGALPFADARLNALEVV